MRNKYLSKVKMIGCKNGNQVYLCECKLCGSMVSIYASHYYRGSTSCKCRNIAVKNQRLYGVWVNMKTRCYNKNVPGFRDYGGRGITVCDEWRDDFKAFYEWALSHGYREDLTIDRIENNKGYSPDNCRWITSAEQNRNKRNNIYYIYQNKKYCLREISRVIGINYKTMCSYYYRHGYTATAQKYNLKEAI